MALTLDYINRIVHSDESITDGLEFHSTLRDIEASSLGVLYPAIHTYREVQLGGGAIFPAVAFINGWTLQFPAGNFVVSGFNLSATINPVPNCYVERIQAAAYAVTAVGGTGLSPGDIASVADSAADSVWNQTIDGGYSAEDILKIMSAVLAGKATIVGSQVVFRNVGDTTDRVTSTATASGGRTAVDYDVS